MNSSDLTSKFWNSLGSHGLMMVGLAHAQAAQPRPMTARVLEGRPPIWFFSSKDNAMVRNLSLTSVPPQSISRKTTISLRPATAA